MMRPAEQAGVPRGFRTRNSGISILFLVATLVKPFNVSAQIAFEDHLVSDALPVSNRGTGDYGLTALVDVNRDGKLDFILGGRGVPPARLYWFEYHDPDHWRPHLIGTNYLSDVGLAALDVDHDGWIDFVCSGVWFRNTGKPDQPFERIVFADKVAGAHDIVVADMNGDGRPDIVMMGDARTELNSISWFEIPENPRNLWTRHIVGPPVHGAIAPNGIGDVDGDGDPDIVRADTWFENRDGKGLDWVPHASIPMGRQGPYGICVRTAFADFDGDGKKEIVMLDADIVDSKAVILRNRDGKGGTWEKKSLPQSFTYGSLHALAIADFNGDGRPDIVSNEQEELLPEGRKNPRWVLWENRGGGEFIEHIILDDGLGGHELQVGDVDGDGDIDICSKAWGPEPWNSLNGKMHVDYLENLLKRNGNHPK